MPRRVTIVKLPPGAPAPAGFTQGRTTRQGVTYFKVEEAAAPVAPPANIDVRAAAMEIDNIPAPVAVEVADDQVDALLAALGAMGLGGRRRRHRKGGQTKKAGRRHRKTRRA